MKIAIGCDHGGLEHKNAIGEFLKENGFEVVDFGIYEQVSVDYPDIAKKLCESILKGETERGILVCGTGIGMSIAANKFKGIRAAACSEHFSAKYTRLHNNSNVLCLGGRVIGVGTAVELADIFVNTEFEGGRHQKRIDKITEIEKI
ncbi:MAG: ribose 5-phosphate isomerase B [Clostridia bacterium]|nr:ribose 5-phosphate isomerase B [Clostridia bacterium]